MPVEPGTKSSTAGSGYSGRRLVAVVFTDIVNYSKTVHRDEVLGAQLLDRQRRVVRDCVPRHGGREVETAGDSFLLEFDSVLSAVRAVIAIQLQLDAENARETHPVVLRASVHIGDVEHRGREVYGDGVNIAARLLPLSPPGGIAVSAPVHQQVHRQLGLELRSIGEPALKNIEMPIEVFVAEPRAVLAAARAAPATAAARDVPGLKSIAVLPFVNTSGDPANEYFSDGLSDELINTLGRLRGLKVMGRTSSFHFKNANADSRTIGDRLGVVHLLEGSVRKASHHVRIAVQLVRTADGANLWSGSYDRELKDIFAVQSEIAGAVAEQLKVKLLGGLQASNAETYTPHSFEAYQALLQGNFFYEHQNDAGMRKAIAHYQRAVKLEPAYALAHAKLGQANADLFGRYGIVTPDEGIAVLATARSAARRATELDPNLVEGRLALAGVMAFVDFDFSKAVVELHRAVQLAPNKPEARYWLGYVLANMGELEAGIAQLGHAIVLDPLWSRAHAFRGRILTFLGRYDEAEDSLRKAIDLQPQAAFTLAYFVALQVARGAPERALAAVEQVPDSYWRTFASGLAKAALGRTQEAEAAARLLIDKHGHQCAYQVAQLYAVLNRPDDAFEWIERGFTSRDAGISGFIWNQFLARHRAHPRYAQLAARLGIERIP